MDTHLIPDQIRRELLLPNSVQLEQLHQGGLSGAVVWRAQSIHGPVALRRWPAEHPSPERLSQIHLSMTVARQFGQHCVPQLYLNRSGNTFSSDGRRLWELTQWMPGRANYHELANTARLAAALRQLATLHRIWAGCTAAGPSPTLAERCQRLQSCLVELPKLHGHLTQRPTASFDQLSAPLNSLTRDTLRLMADRGPALLAAAQPLRGQCVKLHFVIRDIWSDHVLFIDDQVTGIIDFGAARVDEPATDVARLLGSLEPSSGERWHRGWDFYHQVNDHVELRRVELLDRLATLLAAFQWLEWLVLERRQFDVGQPALITRWQKLISRLESWH